MNSFVFKLLRTLLHFFARSESSTPFLSSIFALFAKNAGGVHPERFYGTPGDGGAISERLVDFARSGYF